MYSNTVNTVNIFQALDGVSVCLGVQVSRCMPLFLFARNDMMTRALCFSPLLFGRWRLQGLCEKRAEAFVDCRTVHKVLKRAAEGGFPYLKRRCLEFCVTHLIEVSKPPTKKKSIHFEGVQVGKLLRSGASFCIYVGSWTVPRQGPVAREGFFSSLLFRSCCVCALVVVVAAMRILFFMFMFMHSTVRCFS